METFFFSKQNSVCDNRLAFCSPSQNETWYQYNFYQFIWNQNQSLFINHDLPNSFDIHLLTISRKSHEQRRRTIKSWFNLTNTNQSLSVQVTDDWFPTPLPAGSTNLTWVMYVFLLGHDAPMDPTSTHMDLEANSFVQLQVIQSPPIPIIKEKFAHKWIIAIVIVASFLVIAATCIIVWLYKNMQKHKKQQQQDCSILSTPDAQMIAEKFRQVLSSSELSDQHRLEVGNDILKRQLALDQDMSVSEVERRTSSFRNKKKIIF
ncbi:uncharacterized protein B0P05DRAFT_3679 [Gilbertella persicaria]|uniref:uncharacterized protein n=1 Tax=Gilbertella persicaria TaxID=101096 RepID=UPI00221FA96B|nr:uncharacterized protein B0P05DRAFT_3679 [Gilbertella persicaria]KAI8098229.1 hypothetical protein B0P05DRAFT_3679 [Gilbertella persicaria]